MTTQARPPSRSRKRLSWFLWALLTLVATLGFANNLRNPDQSKEVFLPGTTTHGHYQIELKCDACHKASFTSTADFQDACTGCHGTDLDEAEDSHPPSKFTDPRNADRVAVLDARNCVTCHSEHQPERTDSMGLSLPGDYCYHCHQEIADERPSHNGLAFDSCASAGCHNFHDNRALYEDYLVRHAQEGFLLAEPLRPLSPQRHCPSEARQTLDDRTPLSACRTCHAQEVQTWLESRHGMRVAQGLSPVTPAEARLPMKKSAAHRAMTCASCHDPKRDADESYVFLEACERCHNDDHTRSYRKSKHFELFMLEQQGRVAKGSGVTCGTCHIPRTGNDDGSPIVHHNQNANLRPNEKMIRTVCGNCHGLPFTIDALSDRELVKRNFSGQPSFHVKSVDFALARQ